jgi:hypothetical protein
VTSLDVMKDGNIEPRKFDVLLEALVTAPEEAHVIVDNGASSFIALGAYLQENDVLALLEEAGHTVFFHSIVTGGQALGDTLHGLSRMCVGFPIHRSSSGSIHISGTLPWTAKALRSSKFTRTILGSSMPLWCCPRATRR